MAKILIVDDEKGIRRTLAEFLRSNGYEVIEAEAPDAALQRLQEVEFDVVVTDIIMPQVTGVELLRHIRAADPHVQVVMMTGEPTVETASESMREGAADYLFKPITKEMILRSVAKAAKIKTLEDAKRRLEAENRVHQENLERLVEERTQQLRISEERYRNLVETAFDWVWEVDAQVRYTYASPKVQDMLGYRPEELLGRTPFDLMPEDEAQRVKTLFEGVVAKQQPFIMLENINRHRDGRMVILETSGTPILSSDGTLLGYRGMDRDITDRKKAEQVFKETQANLIRAEYFSGMMVCHVGLDGRWLKVPSLLCMLLGTAPTEMQTETIQAVMHPDDVANDWSQMEKLLQSDLKSFNSEKRFLSRNGNTLWLDFCCALVTSSSDQPLHFLLYLRDITDHKEKNERLYLQNSALEAAANAVVITDLNGVIEWTNNAFTTFTGYSSAEAVGKKPGDLIKSAKHDAAFYRTLWETILAGQVWHGEIINRRKDGSLYNEKMSITPIRNDCGKVIRFIAIKQDITREKEVEAQFIISQRMESVGLLAGGIAHDLNNILSPIFMCLPMLRQEPISKSAQMMLNTIETSIKRGAGIVKQVLVFSRSSEEQKIPLQLRHLIDEMAQVIRETFPKNIALEISCPKDLWPVNGDVSQLHQVLLNLCINARDAMLEGGTLTITATNMEVDYPLSAMLEQIQPGLYLLLEVKDTGSGIAKEYLKKIFDPFYTTKSPDKGTGLGLSTVYGIVKNHGGLVNVASQLGKGTRFDVYLPAVASATVQLLTSATKKPDHANKGNNELILVVDDEKPITDAASKVLNTNGYRTVIAHNGTEAISLYATHQKDICLVLTDLVMPVLDGIHAIRVMRKLNHKVKIIACSGLGSSLLVTEALNLGVNAFLNKPYDGVQLLKTVDDILHI